MGDDVLTTPLHQPSPRDRHRVVSERNRVPNKTVVRCGILCVGRASPWYDVYLPSCVLSHVVFKRGSECLCVFAENLLY